MQVAKALLLSNMLSSTENVENADIATFVSSCVSTPDITVDLEPIQAGTGDPSPDNVRPISGRSEVSVWNDPKYGGFIEWNQLVAVPTRADGTNNGISYHPDGDGGITVSGTATADSYTNVGSTMHGINGHKVACVGCPYGGSSTTFYLRDGYTAQVYDTGSGVIVTKSNDNLIPQIVVKRGVTINAKFYPQFFDLTVMFGEGNEPTISEFMSLFPKSYYNYTTQSVKTCVSAVNGDPYEHATIQLGQTVYGGTVDVTEGKMVIDRALVDMGTRTWTYIQPSTAIPYGAFYNTIQNKKPGQTNLICSTYPVKQGFINDRAIQGNAGASTVYVTDSTYNGDANALKTAVTGQTICYELATPVEVTLTPQQIQTLVGENNVWSDSGNISVRNITCNADFLDLFLKTKLIGDC